ncbi:MAG: hypothetical protein Q4D38_06610 [Planctomycetia bacterium]|nr:hypothetical protein [Planctomycetia bacterium]
MNESPEPSSVSRRTMTLLYIVVIVFALSMLLLYFCAPWRNVFPDRASKIREVAPRPIIELKIEKTPPAQEKTK